MKDEPETRRRMDDELVRLRQRVAELEEVEVARQRIEEQLENSETLYAGVVEHIGIGVSLISPDMEILSLNAQMKQWFPRVDVSKKPICYRAFNSPPREARCSYCPTWKTLADGQVHESVTETPTPEGVRNYRIISSPIKDRSGNVVAAIEMVEDVTERSRAEEALRVSEERFRTLVENVNVGVYRNTGGPHGRFIEANPAQARMFGYDSVDEFLKLRVSDLYENPEERKFFIEEIMKKGVVRNKELRLKKKDGTLIWASVSAAVQYDEQGKIKWIDGVIEDITERKRMEDEIRALSLVDALTGLHNRRGFFTLAERRLSFAKRMGMGMLLLFADLDGMKWINDTLGHREGDKALIEISRILKETFRESDILGRIGGDEFVVLALEPRGVPSEILKTRLREKIRLRNERGYLGFELSLSIGMAPYDPRCACSLEELVAQADRLMYEDKRSKQRDQD